MLSGFTEKYSFFCSVINILHFPFFVCFGYSSFKFSVWTIPQSYMSDRGSPKICLDLSPLPNLGNGSCKVRIQIQRAKDLKRTKPRFTTGFRSVLCHAQAIGSIPGFVSSYPSCQIQSTFNKWIL